MECYLAVFVEPSPLPGGTGSAALPESLHSRDVPRAWCWDRGKACLGCCPSAGFVALLCFELGLCFGRARKPRQEWGGTTHGGLFQQRAEPGFADGFAISWLSFGVK